jgi:hypothetical protein
MVSNVQSWLPRLARFGKILAVVVALAGQISAGALFCVEGPSGSQNAALHAAMILCRGANHPGRDGPPPIHHHLPDPAIAAQAVHFVQQAAIIDPYGVVAPPSFTRAVWSGLPAARAPPPRYAAAAYPTGPPQPLI